MNKFSMILGLYLTTLGALADGGHSVPTPLRMNSMGVEFLQVLAENPGWIEEAMKYGNTVTSAEVTHATPVDSIFKVLVENCVHEGTQCAFGAEVTYHREQVRYRPAEYRYEVKLSPVR